MGLKHRGSLRTGFPCEVGEKRGASLWVEQEEIQLSISTELSYIKIYTIFLTHIKYTKIFFSSFQINTSVARRQFSPNQFRDVIKIFFGILWVVISG